ncbi:PfkB family carbohydrate kinase [Spirochaeta isovalerica]|uniref:Fructose-1-phosphate kinase PfkB-like protein n=1 Tax=Spirochaeta isovalerica TaxID=150 RepID=A0A841RAT2_9SPIO|nr:PfkB family carbohydrate kinase [Spirochaeta isovalerica]MBB6480357.1 fructose-1-phosphate kinase PfkB-like protein [Spirochaeta isovalerica]
MHNSQPGFLTVGLSPAIQKTVVFDTLYEGEVNRSEQYYLDAAGKAVNVCRVLTQAGEEASCLTIAGKENRVLFEDLCSRDFLHLSTVETAGRVRTCTTLLNMENNSCTELVVNEPEEVSPEEEEVLKKSFLRRMKEDFRCLIISGSRARGFSGEIIPFLVRTAKEKGLTVIADYRGTDLLGSFISRKIRPDYIKINEQEFFQTFPEYSDISRGIKEVSEKYDCSFIISRGALSTLIAERGALSEVDSKLIDAVNPIGCGDSMTAGMAQGILEGLSLREAVERGRDYATRNALSIHPGWILED